MGKHILIVDDTQDLLRLMRMVLEDDQHQVSVLEYGREVLATAKTHKPDLIVLDLRLGEGISGLEVLRDLKSDPETTTIPIVVFTASVLLAEEAQRLIAEDPERYGDTRVLRKPFALDELLAIIT